MRAITLDGFGGPAVMHWAEVPDPPPPGPGEVLIRVAAAGVNRADLLQRAGMYPPPPGAGEVLGLEVSGTVMATGTGTGAVHTGDEVCALLDGGGYAEFAVVPAELVFPVPAGLGLVAAAALPEAVCTVWSNLHDVAGLRAGEVVLIHGGGGGIGTMAIQIAAHVIGARVAVTAGSEAKLDLCSRLGAGILVNHREQEFVAVLMEATAGRGADVVLDSIGARYLERNVDVLAAGGRLVVIGLMGGRRAELDLGALLTKRASVAGTTLRSRPRAEKAAIVRAAAGALWPALDSGVIRPVIDAVLPVAEAAEAHRRIEAGENVGKILLAVS